MKDSKHISIAIDPELLKKLDENNYNKSYYKSNKDILNLNSKMYHVQNKEFISEQKKLYYKQNKDEILSKKKLSSIINKEHIKEVRKQYRLRNKEKIAKQKKDYQQKLLSTNTGKLAHNIRQAIRRSLISKGYSKKFSSEQILGCSIQEFKIYIESLFQSWMNWENKGLYNGTECYGWDLDHIIPLASAITEEDVIRLNHYSNIKPLCSKLNRDIKKSNH